MPQYSTNNTVQLNLPKEVAIDSDGGNLTSDMGLILLGRIDDRLGLTAAMAEAIDDKRQQAKVKHTVPSMMCARVLAIAAGYPDCNDLDTLDCDPALKMSCGRCPVTDASLARQSSLSRFENSNDLVAVKRVSLALAEVVVKCLPATTTSIIIDMDATDDPCHGQQEFEWFNKFYDKHCYLPLMFHLVDENGTQWPVAAYLRRGSTGGADGVAMVMRHLVKLLRDRFPGIDITLRADGGFGQTRVLKCAQSLNIHYILGLPQNSRLTGLSAKKVEQCRKLALKVGNGCQVFGTFLYKAEKWPKAERVVVKVESIRGEPNARYVVTNIWKPKAEDIYRHYCGRGDQENRIKEMKLDLCSGRTSCHRFKANALRLLLHLAAHVLWTALRVEAQGTEWAKMQIGTLRLRIVKVAARVVESTRRICIHLSSSYPYLKEWMALLHRLGVRAVAT